MDSKIELELLSEEIYPQLLLINRDDISEDFVDSVERIIEISEYGKEHNLIGHTYAVKCEEKYIGIILMGEAIIWKTDPPEMKKEPFYRIVGFIIDKAYRQKGIGAYVLEKSISQIYKEFGIRPIALGCHKDNISAEKFYLNHGFKKTEYMEGNDYYFLRFP